ncbi:MAG: hypothetical protein V5B39_09085 [Accumulibacter sp.]|jgi:hypothetical protein|uniref:hypothetical protein n=1 Tax=Accumulibacter sp. TaxID=2053492 RepID=UPI002FC3B857
MLKVIEEAMARLISSLFAIITDHSSNIGTSFSVSPNGNRRHVAGSNIHFGAGLLVTLNHTNPILGNVVVSRGNRSHVFCGCIDFGIALNFGPLIGLRERQTGANDQSCQSKYVGQTQHFHFMPPN